MKQITINLYEYDELSEKAKEKALDWWSSASAGDEWWVTTYEDADQIGLKIKGFDCGRSNDIQGHLTQDMGAVIESILANHGDSCETHKLALTYQAQLKELLAKEDTSDGDFDDLRDEFEEELLEEYLVMLRKELEYIQSRENCEENIRANEYTFTIDGKRMA